MIINLIPIVSSGSLSLSVSGDALTVNGDTLDFSPLNEGDTLPAGAINHDFLRAYEATRENGEVSVSVLFPIKATASNAAKFPSPINAVNGVVALPGGEA